LYQRRIASHAEIRADAIHSKVIRIRALPVHAELALVVKRRLGHDHARREHDERLGAASIQGHIFYERLVHHCADRAGGGIHQRRACLHGDAFRDGTNRYFEIDGQRVLRSSTTVTNDLACAITTLGQELASGESNPNAAEFHVEGTTRELHPILRDEVYRIAGEALRNAFKHAQAQRIEVEIRYDERQLRVRVRDDGKGIDPKHLNEDGRPGHYGLRGMRERAKLMGGKLAVWSDLDSGTEVELRIPASRAYETFTVRGRSWWTEKLSGKDTEIKS
jgi:two-component sensor histidine kinase